MPDIQTFASIVPPLVFVHLGTLLFLVVIIFYAEKGALAWVGGKKDTLPAKQLARWHTLVWLLLALMLVSGALLAWPLRDSLVQSAAFYVKMMFVLVLVVNSFFIGRFMKVASEKSFASLSHAERMPILVSGALSALGWIGAFISALFMSTSDWLLYFWNSLF